MTEFDIKVIEMSLSAILGIAIGLFVGGIMIGSLYWAGWITKL